MGVPVFPEAVPGAAVSPGNKTCSLENAPALTVILGLVLAVFVLSLRSVAVTVRPPTVRKVTLNRRVPEPSAALAGKMARASDDVMPAKSLTVLTTFQFASTAFTVMLKAEPAACAEGVPVLPLLVPGAAVSPGTNNCSFTKAAAVTVIPGLVFAVMPA